MFLIARQDRRLGKRDNYDIDVAPIELVFECVHLDQVGLAGQSGKMTMKNQQQSLARVTG